MVILRIVQGNLLHAKEKFIAHQCNCVTLSARGLAQSIAQRYPWANTYHKRKPHPTISNCAIKKDRSIPGSVDIVKRGKDEHIVLCLYAQYRPGKPGHYSKYPGKYVDTKNNRLAWFASCLQSLEQSGHIDGEPIAMPYGIGCGLAGGNWSQYKQMLEESSLEIVLYRLS